MKLVIFSLIAMLFSSASWATVESDATTEGVDVWIHKNMTASQLASTVRDYEVVTAVNAITNAECGTAYFLNSATELASTLPAPVAGCSFKFIVAAAPVGTAYTVVTNGGSDLIDGSAEVNGAVVGCVDEDTITFTASAAISCDWVCLISDGTNWYVSGMAFAATGIACSAT
ncbi:hypothetical protein [Solemya elarraichensis gill symbiont]|uniref:Uncharacterized protein n=1 Tax=Solemya elarraichensis gill symbiont TaxID=1918949 RepID=A0A1T2KZS2_9GAMM|nr:hypothetical protein [Solemya elarraichensis gill symbiont]OOZ38339.1 hypothetical protein BOW52_08740 [Solemya elarraichensis gill symbiont]